MRLTLFLTLSITAAVIAHATSDADKRPNIVFLVVESTDGRAWGRDYQDGAVDLPNIRALQDAGVEFQSHYSNAPVCCPSRATFWSGRHAHNIPHDQKTSGIFVGGVWNNYEGLPANFSKRLDQTLMQEGYNVKMSGKYDWTTGSHSDNVHYDAWTMYTPFPYNLSAGLGGWVEEEGCVDQGTVRPGNTSDPKVSAHRSDWSALQSTVKWIRSNASHDTRPFFVYQGMTIVHPPYTTNSYWFDKVDQDKIVIPEWQDLEDMHPCDFQSSMLKGCLPPSDSKPGDYFYSKEHRVRIRTIYLAMVAEFDAMVGSYVKAVQDAGKYDNTVFIVTSDHGDMQMEHRQFYKMVPYDASSRVPMVVMDGRSPRKAPVITKAVTQLIDIYPTVLTYAAVPQSRWPTLDGSPMQPILAEEGSPAPTAGARPDFVVSQFHGDNIAMSWFLIVQGGFKLVVWGTGDQHPHQLFNLTADPDEMMNLVAEAVHKERVQEMLHNLQSVVDYKAVAKNVAKYGHDSMQYWINTTADWRKELASSKLRWHEAWSQNPDGAAAAIESWLAKPPALAQCRTEKVWPPSADVTRS